MRDDAWRGGRWSGWLSALTLTSATGEVFRLRVAAGAHMRKHVARVEGVPGRVCSSDFEWSSRGRAVANCTGVGVNERECRWRCKEWERDHWNRDNSQTRQQRDGRRRLTLVAVDSLLTSAGSYRKSLPIRSRAGPGLQKRVLPVGASFVLSTPPNCHIFPMHFRTAFAAIAAATAGNVTGRYQLRDSAEAEAKSQNAT